MSVRLTSRERLLFLNADFRIGNALAIETAKEIARCRVRDRATRAAESNETGQPGSLLERLRSYQASPESETRLRQIGSKQRQRQRQRIASETTQETEAALHAASK